MWKWRLTLGSIGALLFAVAGVSAYQAHKYGPTMPDPNPRFIRRIHSDKANRLGDTDFLCETAYCNDSDKYVGIQTHSAYIDGGHMLAGVAAGKVMFIDGSKGATRHKENDDEKTKLPRRAAGAGARS